MGASPGERIESDRNSTMANTAISNALAAYANAAKSLAGGDAAPGADAAAGDSFSDLLKKAATESVKTVQRLTALFRADAERIRGLGRSGASARHVHEVLQARPVASANQLASRSRLSTPTVYTALESLASLGIVRALTGRARRRMFAYDEYLKALSEGTEPVA